SWAPGRCGFCGSRRCGRRSTTSCGGRCAPGELPSGHRTARSIHENVLGRCGRRQRSTKVKCSLQILVRFCSRLRIFLPTALRLRTFDGRHLGAAKVRGCLMFAGIDRSTYPGDTVMQWLWDNTNLYWTGFYLAPAPSHGKDTSWMSRRGVLKQMGWGFAPV